MEVKAQTFNLPLAILYHLTLFAIYEVYVAIRGINWISPILNYLMRQSAPLFESCWVAETQDGHQHYHFSLYLLLNHTGK